MKKILAALAGAGAMTFALSALAETQTAPPAPATVPAAPATTPQVKAAAPANSAAVLLEGANSYTEAQARQRIMDSGFSDVSALVKDDKGIWRGTAMKSGKQASVAVDFKGNVAGVN